MCYRTKNTDDLISLFLNSDCQSGIQQNLQRNGGRYVFCNSRGTWYYTYLRIDNEWIIVNP